MQGLVYIVLKTTVTKMPRQGQSKQERKGWWWPCQESLAPVMISTRPAFEFDKAAAIWVRRTNFCGKWKKFDAYSGGCSFFVIRMRVIWSADFLSISWCSLAPGTPLLWCVCADRGEMPHAPHLNFSLGFYLNDDAMCDCLIAILFGSWYDYGQLLDLICTYVM